MAPNLYPQGMNLHTIGYAALKYPELAPELPIPMGNQLGVLQRQPLPTQVRIMAQIASQYLPALLEYQYSDAPSLSDKTSGQYYISEALALINYLTSNPDIAVRVAKHDTLLHDLIEKLLSPTIEKDMKAAKRRDDMTFEADLGLMLQLVSTLWIRSDSFPVNPPHPRTAELVPILKAWKRKYSGIFISKVSDRLAGQISSPDPTEVEMMKMFTLEHLVCGYYGCDEKKELSACGQCKMMRYCSTDHQKKDWGAHKKICCKGLIEE